jgi:hypothetical protein
MNIDTWAIVFATAAGPFSAVLVARYLEERHAARQRRRWTFSVLMGLRGATLNADHVRALNTVQVEFAEQKKVMAAWRRFTEHLDTLQGDGEESRKRWWDKHRDLLAGLLVAMAKSLRIQVEEVDIRRGGYYPMQWEINESRKGRIEDGWDWLFSSLRFGDVSARFLSMMAALSDDPSAFKRNLQLARKVYDEEQQAANQSTVGRK